MEIVLAMFVFVGLAFAGWIVRRIFDLGWSEFRSRTAVRLRLQTETHIADPDEINLTSRFATFAEDLEDVLALRRSFFGTQIIVPDDVYRQCWQQNRFAFKIVYYLNEPLGYWGIIPVDHRIYQEFLRGNHTHDEMLTKYVKSWSDVQPDGFYLYIIGAVVPPRGDKRDKFDSLLQKELSGRVVLDLYSFANEFVDELQLNGACGYPSRSGGHTLLEKTHGFYKSSVFIDDKSQPIFSLKRSDVSDFRAYLVEKVNTLTGRIPTWDVDDRNNFFQLFQKKSEDEQSSPSTPNAG